MIKNTRVTFSGKFIQSLLLLTLSVQLSASWAETSPDAVFKLLNFSDQEKKDVLSGKLISRTAKERSDKELAVGLAFRINAKPKLLRNNFLKGISIDKPDDIISYHFINSASDFPVLQLSAKELKELEEYLKAKPGNELNLSTAEIKAFNSLEKAKIAKQLQSVLKARYQAYRQGGTAAIAPYQRNDNKQYLLGAYFNKSTQAISPALSTLFPELYKSLKEYPKYKSSNLQERFILLKMTIQGRLAFAMEHRLGMQENGAELMVSRYFYVSHTLNGQQGIGMLLNNGHDAIAVINMRASSDAVAGFGSSTKHFIGRQLLEGSLTEFYQSVQKKYDH